MDAQIERHQPLITARLVFELKSFPPPPIIPAWMVFPSISVPQQYERSPTPEVRTSSEYSSTQRRYTTSKSNDVDLDSTTRRAGNPTRHPTPINTRRTVAIGGVDEDMGSPLTPTSDENNGLDSEEDGENVNTKVPKPPGMVGRPQSGGYNLQDKLGWNDTTYQSILVSFC